MKKRDAKEATAIVGRTMAAMLACVATRGRSGLMLRTAVGDLMAHAEALLQADAAGPAIFNCYDAARLAGITLPQMESVRRTSAGESPQSDGAIITTNALVYFALATIGRIISTTTFVSRQDVEQVQAGINSAFAAAEETAADDMANTLFQALISLHASITLYLIDTGRPLARVVFYRFAAPSPTLVQAYRLYADAGRADELRAENKIVHPAFAPALGRALSQ